MISTAIRGVQLGCKGFTLGKVFSIQEGIYGSLGANSIAVRQCSSATVEEICKNLSNCSSSDQWRDSAKKLFECYSECHMNQRRSLLVQLSNVFGVDHNALKRSIEIYKKNEAAFMSVNAASKPHYFRLFQAIGNIAGGVKKVCDMRSDVLEILSSADLTRSESSVLRPIENSMRELLTMWFCLSNLHLQQLTWESPGDILDKVVKYEAVHPMQGIGDIKHRLGPNKRCYVFQHQAMAREPLVVVYAAFLDKIARSIEDIMNVKSDERDPKQSKTAVFYSISSTQSGLRGIDLGNMLIKTVISEISRTNPEIETFCTLSPLPFFRSWLLRSLKLVAPTGDVIDERLMNLCEENEFITGDCKIPDVIRVNLLNRLTKGNFEMCEEISELLMHLAVRYLVEIKHVGSLRAFDPVANFHLRNGAEICQINWKADLSKKGLANSFGIMVNYRYRLDQVATNTAHYVGSGNIAVNSQTLLYF